ncbi:MAG: alpha/beta fold hydrolase, partial [Gemmatimonadota bacterium]|nr:alpha/beta fold hydrolase [Gemmatimonadota bacterium]
MPVRVRGQGGAGRRPGASRAGDSARGGRGRAGAGRLPGRSATAGRGAAHPGPDQRLPALAAGREAVDAGGQPARAGARGGSPVHPRADDARLHAAVLHRARRGDGPDLRLDHAGAAAAGDRAAAGAPDRDPGPPGDGRPAAPPQRRRRRRGQRAGLAGADGPARIPQAERELVQAVRPVPRRPRRGRRVAPAQGDAGGEDDESVRLADVSARGGAGGRRAVDGRDVPPRPDRPAGGAPARAGLRAVGAPHAGLRGAPPLVPALAPPPLPPDRIYPAGHPEIAVRFAALHDGLRLRLLSAGPETGRPVLLLHGWGASAYSYRWQIPALAAAGHRVIAAELPGHGLSDKPEALDAYTRPAMTAALAELLDVLDLRDALVAGVSMGGGIALGLAVTHHPRVGRVALVNPVGLAPVRFT